MAIKRFLFYILTFTLLPVLYISCNEDIDNPEYPGESDNGELPIDFEFHLPEAPGTRALPGAKTTFGNGNVIHISAKFTLADNSTEIRYGALSYSISANKWQPVASSGLTWPNTAVSGVFTAYHIPTLNLTEGSGGLITDNNEHVSTLQEVTLTSDPLYAATPENKPVSYGNAVNFRFSHLCTYLTLQELKPAYDNFYFSATSVKENANDNNPHAFNNAFYIKKNEDNTLEFDFCQSPAGEPVYYIEAKTVKDSQENTNSGNAGFFLQPGYYDKFTISYPSGAEMAPFMNFNYSPIEGDDDVPPLLEAGTAYILNTVTSPGISIPSNSQEENKPWPDGEPRVLVDVDAFLRAISQNESYTEEGYEILKKDGSSLVLMMNVDFSNYNYTFLSNGEYPNVPLGEILDGNNFTIYNLSCPLFNENNGTIKNLGIENLNADNVVLNQYAQSGLTTNYPESTKIRPPYDFSRQGGICKFNKGKISNLHLTNFSIEAKVTVDNDSDNEENQDTENIGLISGSNSGTIENVRLSGNFSLTVDTDPSDTNGSNCTINMGGLVGQITDTGSINDVGVLMDNGSSLQQINLTNNCYSTTGAYYVGGIVGYNAGYIGNIGVPFINVDCSGSSCTKSFIGIVTGEITTSSKTFATIINTNVSGSAKAGEIIAFKDLDSASYVGGIAGASVLPESGGGITVTQCMVVANLIDNSRATEKGIYSGTGGCFGRIYASFTVNNINLTLRNLVYPSDINTDIRMGTGTFAGFSLSGFKWNWSGTNVLTNTSGVTSAIGAEL